MSFIHETGTTVQIRLTNKGRELLTNGQSFNIVKYCFGDSEIDYTSDVISASPISYPNINNNSVKTKLYFRGVVPIGEPEIIINNYTSNISRNSSMLLDIRTVWQPVQNYFENYEVSNIGDVNYRYISIEKVTNNTYNFTTYDLTGSTQIKVLGLMSNKYQILNFDII